jgi:uncharacterized protein (TIGR02598 family)
MKKVRKAKEAFSLVEVVLALGLFAFCIVAITGLLSVGLGSSRSVVNEGCAVNIASSVFGAWEAQESGDVSLTVSGLFTNLPDLSTSGSNNFFFDQAGVQVSDASQGALQMSYVTEANGDPPEINTTLKLIFSWPIGAATNVVQTRSYSRVFIK